MEHQPDKQDISRKKGKKANPFSEPSETMSPVNDNGYPEVEPHPFPENPMHQDQPPPSEIIAQPVNH